MNRQRPPVDPVFVDIRDTMDLTGLGKTKVFDLIASGHLESVKIGKKRLVRLESIRRLGQAEAA